MKQTVLLAAITLGLLMAGAAGQQASQQAQSAEVLLGAALHQDEVEGNLEAAIATYRKILEAYPDNRPAAAQAQFRMGMCYERLGRREAQKAYEDVVAKYADQKEFAAKARERLTALAGGGAKTMTARQLENPPDDVSTFGAVSPDGRYLSYWGSGTGDLFVRDLQTGQERPLTREGKGNTAGAPVQESVGASAWSADGTRVGYIWYIGGTAGPQRELRTVDLKGGQPRTIAVFGPVQSVTSLDWSPEGRTFAACVTGQTGSSRIVAVSAADGSIRTLLELKREIFPTTVRFAPDGRSVVFDFLPDPGAPERDIHMISLATGAETPLVRHPADDYLLGWSRDGRWIVFASDRGGALGLWRVEASGNRPTGEPELVQPGIDRILPIGLSRDGALFYGVSRATEDVFTVDLDPAAGKIAGPARRAIELFEGGNFSPCFSPDGKTLAYVSRRGNSPYPTNVGNALCLRSMETGEERVFYREFWRLGVRCIDDPSWSSDGRSLVVLGIKGMTAAGSAFYRIDLGTNQITPIIQLGADEASAAGAFGPEGTFIFVRLNRTKNVVQLLTLDATSGRERELASVPGRERAMTFALSPDRSRLAFANTGWGGIRSLKVMPLSGGEAKEVWNFGKTEPGLPTVSLAWTPDGQSLLFSASDPTQMVKWDVWRISADGGTPQKIGLQRRWGMWGLSLRPDGRQLAFAGRAGASSDSELWVLENFLPPASRSK